MGRAPRPKRQPTRRAPKFPSSPPDPSRRVGAANGKVSVTYPGGQEVVHPDDGRDYPVGTMLMWDEKVGDRMEMRWTTVGGCPFACD